MAAASVSTVVNLVTAGHAVKVFYGGVYGSNWDWLATASIGTFADLRGKRIGVSAPGSLVDWFTRHALRRHGLDPDRDVQMMSVGGSPFAYQALRAGRIDAAMLAPPFKWQAAAAGFRVIGTAVGEVTEPWPEARYLDRRFIDTFDAWAPR